MSNDAKRRTLSDLMRLDDSVWVRIETEELWRRFVSSAAEEGFRLGTGSPLEAERDDVVVIHSDKRISYPGFCGHIGFGLSESPMTRVDYGAYIAGRDDFLLRLAVERRLISTDRPSYVKSESVWV